MDSLPELEDAMRVLSRAVSVDLNLQDFVGRAILSLGSQDDFVVLDGVSVGL